MKIAHVANASQREQIASAVLSCLSSSSEDREWLRKINERGIPLYGSEPGHAERIVRLNPDASHEHVNLAAAEFESSDRRA